MKLEWMGPYREFVDSLVKFGNIWSRATNTPEAIKSSVNLSGTELQVLEYILENEELNLKMAEISHRLYIPQSSFSKIVKQLTAKGLLEKEHAPNNNKDVIVSASGAGRKVYEEYIVSALNGKWGSMFSRLDELPPEAVQTFTDILNAFSGTVVSTNQLGDDSGEAQ